MSFGYGQLPTPARGPAPQERQARIEGSARYRSGRFHNTSGVGANLKSEHLWSASREFVLGGKPRTPPGPLLSVDPRRIWQQAPMQGLRATWLGHSTVLIEIGGYRILTDPVWVERASPVGFAGPRRFQPVPVALEELPPLSAVIISHDHYDHLDRATVERLAAGGVPFITSLGVGARLEAYGVPSARVIELDWWEHTVVGRAGLPDLEIIATPSQHFSGRGLTDRYSTLWSSFVLRTPSQNVFFGADSGLTREYQEIGERLGPFDLAMLEIGAFHPAWSDIHLGPENALTALQWLGSPPLLPIHWGTFDLALHAWHEPPDTLLELGTRQGARLLMPPLGSPVEPGRTQSPSPWWREHAGQ